MLHDRFPWELGCCSWHEPIVGLQHTLRTPPVKRIVAHNPLWHILGPADAKSSGTSKCAAHGRSLL